MEQVEDCVHDAAVQLLANQGTDGNRMLALLRAHDASVQALIAAVRAESPASLEEKEIQDHSAELIVGPQVEEKKDDQPYEAEYPIGGDDRDGDDCREEQDNTPSLVPYPKC